MDYSVENLIKETKASPLAMSRTILLGLISDWACDTRPVFVGSLSVVPVEWLDDEEVVAICEHFGSYMMIDDEEGWDGIL